MTRAMGTDFWTGNRTDVHKWILTHIRTMGLPQRLVDHAESVSGPVQMRSPGRGTVREVLLRDPAFHDDVESEVFMAFYHALVADRIPATVSEARAWLYGTTRYVTWRLGTRQAIASGDQVSEGAVEMMRSTTASPAATAAARETLIRVWGHVPSLPVDQRDAIYGACEGESPDETAQRLGKKAGTVRVSLCRARRSLKAKSAVSGTV